MWSILVDMDSFVIFFNVFIEKFKVDIIFYYFSEC